MATKKKNRTAKSKPLVKKEAAKTESNAGFTPSGIKIFVQEVQAEFNKVVWPQKKVTVGLTGFVILLVVLISLYLGAVDLLLGKLVISLLN